MPQITQRQLSKYVACGDAASILGVSTVRLSQLIAGGRVPYLSSAAGRLFPKLELEQLAQTRNRSSGRPRLNV